MSAALVSVILYSSAAAIHAIVAAVAVLTQLITRLAAIRENYKVVLIDGASQTDYLEQGSAGGSLWLSVIPMVYEADANAILAIVGFAFLCLLSMQARSRTLRDAKPPSEDYHFRVEYFTFRGTCHCIPLRHLCYNVVLSPARILSFRSSRYTSYVQQWSSPWSRDLGWEGLVSMESHSQ